ncbi:MAG TPA: ribosome maturation factor RimP, partial [Candidatus Obscuribacterales bacterium]|nr:ribosome maturation factor RimP [Candidatus Obscuribacterales bacterium]
MLSRKPEDVILEVTALAEKIAAPLGFQVVDVRLTQQGRRKSVEVTIFSHTKAVGLSDCEVISRQLGELLEPQSNGKPAIIEGSYYLEVQSPGIERELKTPREFQ